jgi:hypothetical protein
MHIARACREARRQRGLTQADVAREVAGLSQPSLSRFESGRGSLPEHVVAALAGFLGVDVQAVLRRAYEAVERMREPQVFVCESPWCPSVRPVEVGSEVRFVPTLQRSARESLYCRWCGHKLIANCAQCAAAVESGIFCTECGTPYVSLPLHPAEVGDARTWAAEERERRAAITGLAVEGGGAASPSE